MKQILKAAILAWGLPLGMLSVFFIAGVDPSRSTDSFSRSTFKPVKKEIIKGESSGRFGSSDHFELWLEAPDHSRYFIRDPEPEPIDRYYSSIPDEELTVIYDTYLEGDRILSVTVTASGATPIAFAKTMAGEKSKIRLVLLFALIFSVIGHVFLWFAIADWRASRGWT